jgi:hypothetical protein
MKRSLIVLFLVLLGAAVSFASPFANPFAGKWDALITSDDRYLMGFVATDNVIIQIQYSDGLAVYSPFGKYTYDDKSITVDGQTWLYYVLDSTHIMLVGFIKTDSDVNPAWVMMHKKTDDVKSDTKPAFKQ